jgi:hypothetical protein
MRAMDREVRKRTFSQSVGIIEDSKSQARAELPEAMPAPQDSSAIDFEAPGDPLNIREVAKLIGCSVWTVRQRCLRQGLPHFRASRTGRLIFYRNQVIRWLIHNQTERRF